MPKTCGQCHPGAGERFAIGPVHVSQNASEPPPLRFVRGMYLLLIPVTIGLMLLHNLGDWLRKLIRTRFRKAVRRLRAERPRQRSHASFRANPARRDGAILPGPGMERLRPKVPGAVVGPPAVGDGRRALHAQPDSPHRRGGVHAGGLDPRGFAHRQPQAAQALEGDAAQRNDPREALSNFAYNLGLGTAPPDRSPHSYIEKAEYWAVVWGAMVMASTGILLWANNIALRVLPKTWLDVATSVHFYEAVLATLAIVVWHFYSVIFDPDIYPLNTAFDRLSGRTASIERKTPRSTEND